MLGPRQLKEVILHPYSTQTMASVVQLGPWEEYNSPSLRPLPAAIRHILRQPLSGKDMDRTKQPSMLQLLKGQRYGRLDPLETSLLSDLGATAVQALELVRIADRI